MLKDTLTPRANNSQEKINLDLTAWKIKHNLRNNKKNIEVYSENEYSILKQYVDILCCKISKNADKDDCFDAKLTYYKKVSPFPVKFVPSFQHGPLVETCKFWKKYSKSFFICKT